MPKCLDILRLDLGNTLSSPGYKTQDGRDHDMGKSSDDQTTLLHLAYLCPDSAPCSLYFR